MDKHAEMDRQNLWQKNKMIRITTRFGLFSRIIVRLFSVEQDINEKDTMLFAFDIWLKYYLTLTTQKTGSPPLQTGGVYGAYIDYCIHCIIYKYIVPCLLVMMLCNKDMATI